MKKILILSPHTDDAELGCGGSIIKFIEEKHQIMWHVFSSAEDSLPENLPKDTLKKEFLNVCSELNLNNDQFVIDNYSVRRLDESRQEILETLVKIRNTFSPDLVIGPSLNDFHQDHQVIANEMIRAFKTTSSIICYELPWNHITFTNQMFIKLKKEHIEKKYNILSNYKSQLIKNRRYFSKEFINGLAKTRGIQVNTEFAEAFEVIRWIIQ